MQSTEDANLTRRDFLGRSAIFTVGAGLAAPLHISAQERPKNLWMGRQTDAIWTQYGHMRVVNFDEQGKTITVPIAFSAPGDRAAIDLSASTPTIRFGTGKMRLELTPKGISFQESEREFPWSKSTVKRLLDTMTANEQLSKDVLALRLAVYATYPEYIAHRKSQAPKKLVAQRSKTAKHLATFGKKPSSSECRVETVIENVVREVTECVDDILTAAEQLDRCVDRCYDQYLKGSKDDWIGYGLCDLDCGAQSFEDVFEGLICLVDTITEPVEKQVLLCTITKFPKGSFPNPFDLPLTLPDFLGMEGATSTSPPAFSKKEIDAAITVVTKMVKTLPGAIRCIVEGQWDLVTLRDIRLDVPGVAEAPVAITVCMDHDCAMKLLGAGLGKDAFTIIGKLITLAGTASITNAVAALSVSAALVPSVELAVLALLVFLIVLMIHLMIVAGEIVVQEALGLIDNGICITHPSMPIAALGVINPVVGLVALANVPLIVTPR